jgi:hypothetical protein
MFKIFINFFNILAKYRHYFSIISFLATSVDGQIWHQTKGQKIFSVFAGILNMPDSVVVIS